MQTQTHTRTHTHSSVCSPLNNHGSFIMAVLHSTHRETPHFYTFGTTARCPGLTFPPPIRNSNFVSPVALSGLWAEEEVGRERESRSRNRCAAGLSLPLALKKGFLAQRMNYNTAAMGRELNECCRETAETFGLHEHPPHQSIHHTPPPKGAHTHTRNGMSTNRTYQRPVRAYPTRWSHHIAIVIIIIIFIPSPYTKQPQADGSEVSKEGRKQAERVKPVYTCHRG